MRYFILALSGLVFACTTQVTILPPSAEDDAQELPEPEPIDPEPSDPEPSDPEPGDPEPGEPEPGEPEPGEPEPGDPVLPTFEPLADADMQLLEAKRAEANAPGLATCIVKEGRVHWCGGFGQANIATQTLFTPHTPMITASVSKAITAIPLLQLRDEGEIDFAERADAHFDYSIDHPQGGAAITLGALMTHTAGITDDWATILGPFVATPPLGELTEPPLTVSDAVRSYFDVDGDHYSDAHFSTTPNSAYEYTNMGVALLGAVAEAVTEQDFASLVDERVAQPLNLTRTKALAVDLPVAPAMIYDAGNPLGHNAFADIPNGGIYSSAYDLARILAAITNGGTLDGERVLSQSTVSEMLSNQSALSPGQGLIWFSFEVGNDTFWGHNGDIPGVATSMFFRESDGLGYVIFQIQARGEAVQIGYDVEKALIEIGERI